MKRYDFDKLERIYNQLIDLVSYAKECEAIDIKMDCFWKMFQIVRACLEFSPYTHFYTQVLIDIIIKTYNTKIFRSDLLFKSQIGALNQQKERINESTILTEYHREYKRMYGIHYNHPDKFNEKKFKKWSKKSKQLIEKYSDEQIEEFKQELKEFSDSIFKI